MDQPQLPAPWELNTRQSGKSFKVWQAPWNQPGSKARCRVSIHDDGYVFYGSPSGYVLSFPGDLPACLARAAQDVK